MMMLKKYYNLQEKIKLTKKEVLETTFTNNILKRNKNFQQSRTL